LVNAGFYVLEPETLKDIPKNTFFHITDLINKYIEEGKKLGTYPITENSWLDMGEMKEMDRMIEKLGEKNLFNI
jgi:NDP-sugar pyrophosphorylase family protein